MLNQRTPMATIANEYQTLVRQRQPRMMPPR
ncbi:hypothetical protein OESDEN_17635 [Oesophagostomum dentatum]|uniref:Uncharacterized protein n=1 Tax=Oesophagostomum dentatum TaxID=61180 RepID=A0A0B1SFN1_OESDE|nr:hypothetical protein OESDEN_17635 [Oesophagostomum dentatum]